MSGPPQYPGKRGSAPPPYHPSAQPPYPAESYDNPYYTQSADAPPPAYPSQNAPPPSYPSQGIAPPTYPSNTAPPAYPSQGGPPPAYPSNNGPPPAYPSNNGPPPAYPSNNGPPPAYTGADSDMAQLLAEKERLEKLAAQQQDQINRLQSAQASHADKRHALSHTPQEEAEMAASPEARELLRIRRCKRHGCGKQYKEKDNHAQACQYHPDTPAVKLGRTLMGGWNMCCIQSESSSGCTKGYHYDGTTSRR